MLAEHDLIPCRAPLENKADMAARVTPVSREAPATLAAQACLGRPANPALLDQKELRERLAHWVVLVLSASLVPLAHKESVVCLACPVHLVLLADKESVESL